MKLSDPIESIMDDVHADLVAVRPVVVDRASPRSSVPVRKVGAELAQIISFRSKVVIHYIQYDGDALFMAGVDEGSKRIGLQRDTRRRIPSCARREIGRPA